jgi:outer membrane murein-binding lipoprotein Lpp
MKKVILPVAAVSALLFAAGCSDNASTENQSTNAPEEQQPPAINTNSSSGAEMTNATPSAGADTNNPATTNGMTPP